MTVYIDNDFKCYAAPADGLTAVDAAFFDGKCGALIECYRFVPAGQIWTRNDGAVFVGEMVAPHKDTTAAILVQAERDSLTANAGDYVAAYEEGVQSA